MDEPSPHTPPTYTLTLLEYIVQVVSWSVSLFVSYLSMTTLIITTVTLFLLSSACVDLSILGSNRIILCKLGRGKQPVSRVVVDVFRKVLTVLTRKFTTSENCVTYKSSGFSKDFLMYKSPDNGKVVIKCLGLSRHKLGKRSHSDSTPLV